MSTQSYDRAAIEAALSTKAPKHMRVNGTGTPAQRFNVGRFVELCERRGIDPADAALKLLASTRAEELKAKELLDAYLRLMEFAYPKQRAVEHSGNLTVGLPELLAEVEEEWQARQQSES